MLRFGTDGVRGDADTDLTSPSVVALGRAAARVIGAGEFLIGRDTRESGPRIDADLTQGFVAEGAHVTSLGVASTPAIAFLAQRAGVPAAIVSASHNPWNDNGVKIVGTDGRKLADELERAIEAELRLAPRPLERLPPASSPAPSDVETGPGRRSRRVCRAPLGALDGRTLAGVHRRGRLRQRRGVGAGAARVRGGRRAASM